jgi:ATP-dependent DNA helicase RecQ
MTARREAIFARFRDGAEVEDVMHQTGLTRSTINDYLAEYVRMERPKSVSLWVANDVYAKVAAAAKEHGTAKLKPVFLALGETVSYDLIRVVFSHLDAGRGGEGG